MSKRHDIKLSETYWDDVMLCTKTFEIRENDRDYQVGDTVVFSCVDVDGGSIPKTGAVFVITYITTYEQKFNWCVFSIELTNGRP